MKKISQKLVGQALAAVAHPEIDQSLVDLGMIEDVILNENKVSLSLKIPFPEVPIRKHLVEMIKKAFADLDQAVEIEVAVVEMDSLEREEFMKKAREGWKL